MNKRDINIIKDLECFRVLSRDDIVDLYFSHLKSPVTNANSVLKRLVRDGKIEVSKYFTPYAYFPYGSNMKRNSTKIPHFLKIVEVYKQLKHHTDLPTFQVEPKFQKGLAEPDAYTLVKGKPFFIEIQRNRYSQKVMNDKIKRYEALYRSNEFKVFPYVIMLTDAKYVIESEIIKVFQVESIHEFMRNVQKKPLHKNVKREIKFKIG